MGLGVGPRLVRTAARKHRCDGQGTDVLVPHVPVGVARVGRPRADLVAGPAEQVRAQVAEAVPPVSDEARRVCKYADACVRKHGCSAGQPALRKPALGARSCLRSPQALDSLGQSVSWAALARKNRACVLTWAGADLHCGEDHVDDSSDNGDSRGRHQAHLAARRDEALHQRGHSTPRSHRPIKPFERCTHVADAQVAALFRQHRTDRDHSPLPLQAPYGGGRAEGARH